jgi:Flp pilus assembly protein TadB
MLSDREQQELARIEAGLQAEDRRFADGLRKGPRIEATRRWPARALLGFGVLLLVVGALTSAGMLVFQGIVFTAAGVLWLRWQAARRGRSDGAAGFPVRPAGHPDGPPTGRGQPV